MSTPARTCELRLQTFEGRFVKPTYHFGRTQAGGHAERVEFLGEQRAIAHGATYSSCRVDDELDAEGRYVNPAWELRTRRLRMDFAANEGIAEGAVLRFYGVPILAAPVLSFPLTDARKSGWLPPSIAIDSNSGPAGRRALLLEHRAEPRCDADAAPDRQARGRPRHRIPLPGAGIPRQRQSRSAAERPARRARPLFAGAPACRRSVAHDRSIRCGCCGSRTTTTGRISRRTCRA